MGGEGFGCKSEISIGTHQVLYRVAVNPCVLRTYRESDATPTLTRYQAPGITGDHVKIGPTVQTKTYIFRCFYQQYLVLFTMVPRNSTFHQHDVDATV